MTNEQREAVEFLEFYKQHCLKIEIENMDNYETIHDGDFVSKNLDTVLSLIKEQQEEIVNLKVNLAKSCADRTLDRETLKNQENENLEALHRAYNEEISKKDKQIDLMAKKITMTKPTPCTSTNEFSIGRMYMSKEEIKQYFERKVEDVES